MRGAIPPLPPVLFMAWCLVKHKDNFTFTFMFMCTPGLLAQALYSRLCLMFIYYLRLYEHSRHTAVCLTAAKFDPFIIPLLSFALACIANIYIFMILYDFCCCLQSFVTKLYMTEFWTPDENRGSVCAMVNYQWSESGSVKVRFTSLLTVGRSVSPSVRLDVKPLRVFWPDFGCG
jgi:hypothetical protein